MPSGSGATMVRPSGVTQRSRRNRIAAGWMTRSWTMKFSYPLAKAVNCSPCGDDGANSPYNASVPPTNGQTFEMISHSPHWGEDRVVYRAADGTLPSIAAVMTDLAQPDAFRRIAAGRAAFRTADLVELVALLDRISAPVEADDA